MINYLERDLEERLLHSLKAFPAVLVTGARQTGKSTLLRERLPHYRYVTLDDLISREQAIRDPQLFLSQYSPPVIIDEIQYAPQLLSYIKIKIDEQRDKYGQYVLTGSQMFQMMQGVSETLAGRIAVFQLYPLSWHELVQSAKGKIMTLDAQTMSQQIIQGFYPELCVRDYPEPDLWFQSYITTYLEKDIRQIKAITDLSKFQTLLNVLAARAGNLLNLSAVANECRVSQPTVKAWITLLESTSIIYLLKPYYTNKIKRLVQMPKLYFCDTGLLCYLLGIDTSERFFRSAEKGAIFENMVIMDVLKQASIYLGKTELFFYRTPKGVEVDLIVKNKQGLHALEIKLAQTIDIGMTKNLQHVSALEKFDSVQLVSLHEQDRWLTKEVRAIHWREVNKIFE